MTPAKMLITYDISEETLNEYHQFMLETFLPKAQELGLVIVGVWYTAYGEGPERHTELVTKNEDTMWRILHSPEWEELEQELQRYAVDFGRKVVPYKQGFQL